jgi:hypothetical protein
MGTTDYGIEKVGSAYVGGGFVQADYCEFGIGSDIFNSGSNYLVAGIIRKEINWSWLDGDPRGSAFLATTEANGSQIGEYGFGEGSTVAGSNIHFRELSAVGTKDNTFDVEISMKVRIRRST